MITYRRAGLTFAEFYLDEPLRDPVSLHADIVRCLFRTEPIPDLPVETTQTLLIDLGLPDDLLLSRMPHMSRRQIRTALNHDEFRIEVVARGKASPDIVADFEDFYDRFANHKGLRPLYRPRLQQMSDAGMLDVSRIRSGDDTVLVWHATLVVGKRVMLLHMPSVLAATGDGETRSLIGRANRCLHWFNIRRHRQDGRRIYDLGGYPMDRRDPEKQGIATFKESLGGELASVYTHAVPCTFLGSLALPFIGFRHGKPLINRPAFVSSRSNGRNGIALAGRR